MPDREPTVLAPPPESPWMTTKEAAAYLKRGRRFVLREIHAGRLRAAKIGGRGEILTNRAWLDAFVTELAKPVVVLPRRVG
jgi:excisionase family DNA binding protein